MTHSDEEIWILNVRLEEQKCFVVLNMGSIGEQLCFPSKLKIIQHQEKYWLELVTVFVLSLLLLKNQTLYISVTTSRSKVELVLILITLLIEYKKLLYLIYVASEYQEQHDML